jgi:formate C-acetyltransferase
MSGSVISDRVMNLRDNAAKGEHRKFRTGRVPDVWKACDESGLDWPRRASRLTKMMCEAEMPIILPGERIAFTRTVPAVPPYYSPEQWEEKFAGYAIHESGIISNICADWGLLLRDGLAKRKEVINGRYAREGGEKLRTLSETVSEAIDAVLALAERYVEKARSMGEDEIAKTLSVVPLGPARSFLEALQSLKFVHSVLWLSGHYHVGLGRFDQYMWPYALGDAESGLLSWNDIGDLIAEFFVSLNKDSDLYPGIQQGDNGQSLMLGGVDCEGKTAVNKLTYIVLDVTRAVRFIDPKINLRITPDTPRELLLKAVELTKIGLGFPQYSNDNIVIPGLVKMGYDLRDARDYSVAACWEFLIPGHGMDIVNIGAVSFPYAADYAIREVLGEKISGREGFSKIMSLCEQDIERQVGILVEAKKNILLPPAPLYSAVMTDQLEKRGDISEGGKYNNLGIHGAGSANAADAIAAAGKNILEETLVSPAKLLYALDSDFADDDELLFLLREKSPKTGNNDDCADNILRRLFDYFAKACERYQPVNERWRRVRPGTGSAMYYVWLARGHEDMLEPVVGATADGRKKGDFFSSSLAPAHGVKVSGPFGILQSFSKIDYSRVCNGGPITLELSDTVFRNEDSIGKVADLVALFARLGCQQMQLNTLNADELIDAKNRPERHRNLVVRVWGWSGYFCELSEEYQDHIIKRHMLAV